MKKLSRRLKKQRRTLLQRYDDEELHQLRITLRRMRGRLKGEHAKKPRRLRKDLGTLADTTNPARDWDTLAARARALMTPGEFESLTPWLNEHQQSAHRQVLEMLESELWSDTIARCKRCSPDRGKPVGRLETPDEEGLGDTLQRVSAARNRALKRETVRDWHKLRITIKELRYRLDELPKDERDPQVRQTLAVCKQLQEELGRWHDTVVHRQLLRDSGQRSESETAPAAVSAFAILAEKLAREGEECLDRVRSMLTEPAVERALKPGPR